jgi:hypothetical protein
MLRPDKSGLQHDSNILFFGAYQRMEEQRKAGLIRSIRSIKF